MGTEQSARSAGLASTYAANALLAASPMTVIDVGASGGLDLIWRSYEPNLRALCFDPLVAEIDRLQAAEKNSKVTYHDAFIVANEAEARPSAAASSTLLHDVDPIWLASFNLSSCMRAIEVTRMNYEQQIHNAGKSVRYSQNRTSLDSFLAKHPEETIDFIKSDTDGHDFDVFRGAEATLREMGVLGALIECPFHAEPHEEANIFSNVDLYMKRKGFELFDLDVQRYSRRALPDRFRYDIPAQTYGGQVQWGEALFFRDPVLRPELLEHGSAVGTPAKQLKLVLLYDSFGLKDCAAQLITMLRDRGLGLKREEWNSILDILAQGNPLGARDYSSYIAAFEADPLALFRSRIEARMAAGDAGAFRADRDEPELQSTSFAHPFRSLVKRVYERATIALRQ